ncbi:acyl carrier protein [Flexivirga oryzae]|uniref:Acyl carrier protein n=1 Tax=Flexivirga oryzae TaxID=1794944 RepID=A0A839N609_9MICO|nr:acyl carrier protein [Flexivirga oryzae]MBB2890162.1 acyl carrier protein [Flexivirga oryzae]
MEERIKEVLAAYGRLPNPVESLGPNDDLYRAGLTSHASVNVMLGLEDEFDIEFPDSMLRKSTFESIAAIEAALQTLSDPSQLPA